MKRAALIDTSAWIDYFNDRKTLAKKVKAQLSNHSEILIRPIILQELLQGIRIDSDYIKVKRILLSFEMLEIDTVEAAIGAADLYRNLRKKGITIRKSNDCLVAHHVLKFKIPSYTMILISI